jgi:hypothetical protein
MASRAKGDSRRSDRHQRAKLVLDEGAKHVEEWLDRVSTLLSDGTELASEMLQQSAPPDQCFSDAVAFSINALSTFCCCPQADGESATALASRKDLPATINLVFDIMSETAGPVEFATSAPLTSRGPLPALVGSAGTIPSACLLVRTLDTGIMISLCDLRNIPPGVYEGTLTFADSTGASFSQDVSAECRDELWWL